MFELPEPHEDGLFIPEVGEWSKDKHHYLSRYLKAFTTAMKDKKWEGLHYIDLFAGAGIEKIRGTDELTWGSPLIAAQAQYPFKRLHLCEKDKNNYLALIERVNKHTLEAQILNGDANEEIHAIIGEIPEKSLSLAFLDPYGLHLDYETLKVLSKKRSDIIIFLPDYMDALRNWATYYLENPESTLDRFLGSNVDWRNEFRECPQHRRAEVLRDLYVHQIKKLGYKYFEYERIYRGSNPLYILIFCSKNKIGADIWRRVTKKKPDGQSTFDFG